MQKITKVHFHTKSIQNFSYHNLFKANFGTYICENQWLSYKNSVKSIKVFYILNFATMLKLFHIEKLSFCSKFSEKIPNGRSVHYVFLHILTELEYRLRQEFHYSFVVWFLQPLQKNKQAIFDTTNLT